MHYFIPFILLVFNSLILAESPPSNAFEQVRKFESAQKHQHFSLDADSLHSYDQLSLHLEYRVENADVPMTGIATVTIVGREDKYEILFNAEGLTVSHIHIGNNPASFIQINDTVFVFFHLLPQDTVTLEFTVSVPNVGDFSQVGYHVDWNRVFTFAEPYGARRWYPCWDQPYDKFNETTVAINMPADWILASNGVLTETTFPEAGRKRQVYHNTNSISSYLVSIAAGLYSNWSESANGVNYNFFAYPEHENMARYDWARVPEMVELFNSRYGQYSFSSYGMAEASLFNGWGAMEHQTLTTLGSHLTDSTRYWEGIYAHELAHQWGIERIRQIVRGMLDLHRGGSVSHAQINLNDLAQKVTTLVNRQLREADIKLKLTLDPQISLIEGSPQEIQQVILNLVLNAVEAMPNGGELLISSSLNSEDKTIELVVQDTGIGISEEHLGQIFEPFFTYRPSGNGTGLGLYLSKNIMEMHHGFITADSQKGKGAKFTLHFHQSPQ